ncbi:hypothetical protein GCM10022408_11450 [Hymenobacter fastidiosus]|uniref:Abortive phage infection protein C-terminal domain-containing protein n=1 Tax=Hymenobacter fastidiosus TaxID=486264 RepID=A0ABP7RT33_9BACT
MSNPKNDSSDLRVNNVKMFLDGYLSKIAEKFNVSRSEAFEIFSIASVLDKPFGEVRDCVIVKRKQDGGIDGVYFEDYNGEYTMHLFQCKDSPSLKQNDIEKFKSDCSSIFVSGSKLDKPNLLDLKEKILEYKNLLNKGKIVDIKQYFLYNGHNKDSKYMANESTFNAFNIKGEFEVIDADDLYARVSSLIKSQNRRNKVEYVFNPQNSNITSQKDNQGLISFSKYEVKAAIFRLDAIELCEMLEKEKQVNGTIEKMFSENIRWFLGKKNLTNEKIAETLRGDKSYYFPFLNNGITIICDEFRLPQNAQMGKYIIPVVNPVIVNGLQTSYIIYQQYLDDKDSLADVSVTIRLYQTGDPDLVEQITDATNTQSAISFKDKISNKHFNVYAKEVFDHKSIGYISKRGEVFTNLVSINAGKTVRSDFVLKLWYASFYEEPYIACFQEQVAFKDIYQASVDSKNYLNSVFNGDINSPLYSQMFFAYSIYDVYQNEYRKTIGAGDKEDRVDNFRILSTIEDGFIVYMVYKLLAEYLEDVSIDDIVQALDDVADIVKSGDDSFVKDKESYLNAYIHADYEDDIYRRMISEIMSFKNRKKKLEAIYSIKVNLDKIVL